MSYITLPSKFSGAYGGQQKRKEYMKELWDTTFDEQETLIPAPNATFQQYYTLFDPAQLDVSKRAQQIDKKTEQIIDSFCVLYEKFSRNNKGGLQEVLTYHSFQIPKRTGGHRTITAPHPILKQTQRSMLHVLQQAHAHNAAHGFVPGRGTKTALAVHQQARSNWFLKIDLKEFFPSMTALKTIMLLNENLLLQDMLRTSIRQQNFATVCFDRNKRLPQGAPTSPHIANLVLTKFDDAVTRYLSKPFTYTRYADDLIISSYERFDAQKITDYIAHAIQYHTKGMIQINPDKTRFGSRAGRNRHLGLILNKDNNITYGAKNKQKIRAALYQLQQDRLAGREWPHERKDKLEGMLAYLHHIEPEYIDYIKTKYDYR